MTKRFAIGLALLLLGASAALADPPPLKLAEARRRALEKNWELLAARSDVDLAVAAQLVAREIQNPSLAVSTTQIPTDGTPAGTALGNGFFARSYDTTVAVSQLLEGPHKRGLRRASAAASRESAEQRFADARRLLDAGVVKAYAAAALAAETGNVLAATARSLRESARIAADRLRAGDISQAEESQVEVEAARFELDARSNDAQAQAARIALDVLMGEPQPGGDWRPADGIADLAHQALLFVDGRPGAPRPDLLAAEAALRRATADRDLERARRFPDPTLAFQYERQPPDRPNTVGFGVAFDLPLWNRRDGEIAAAEAARAQAERDVERAKAAAAAEQATAHAQFSSAQLRLRSFEGEILPKADSVRDSVVFAYQHGGASLLELLEAERNANDLRLQDAQAAADALSAAADLAAALNLPLFPDQP